MVGTGANRMPLTKIHPILLGQQKGDGGPSLLAQHRQQHQERLHQRNAPSSAPNQVGNSQFQMQLIYSFYFWVNISRNIITQCEMFISME